MQHPPCGSDSCAIARQPLAGALPSLSHLEQLSVHLVEPALAVAIPTATAANHRWSGGGTAPDGLTALLLMKAYLYAEPLKKGHTLTT